MEAGKDEVAERRMTLGDGRLALQAVTSEGDINWEDAKIIGREKSWSRRQLF